MPVVHVLRQRRGDPADGRDARSSATSTRETFCVTPETVQRGADAAHEGGRRRRTCSATSRRSPRSRRSACPCSRTPRRRPAHDSERTARPGALGTRRDVLVLSRPRTSARFGDGGAITTADDALAERVRTLRFHGSRDKVTLRAGRLQLAPRRAPGGGPARACCRELDALGRRPPRRRRAGTRRPGSATSSRCRGRAAGAARRGTSTSCATRAPTRCSTALAQRGHRRARLLPHAGPPPAGDGALRGRRPSCPAPTRRRARTSRCRSAPRSRARRSPRSAGVAARSREVAAMRVWVDLTNSPHVLVLRPGDRARCERAAPRCRSPRATSRRRWRCASASGIDARRRSAATAAGALGAKALGLVGRSLALRALGARAALRPRARPRLQRRHGRRARCCAIPSATMFDYEWATRPAHGQLPPGAQPSWCPTRSRPSACAATAPRGKIRAYPGLKEEYYLADFEPDAAVLGELGLDREQPLAVVRTPPAVSLYHRFENDAVRRRARRACASRARSSCCRARPSSARSSPRPAASSCPSARSTRQSLDRARRPRRQRRAAR